MIIDNSLIDFPLILNLSFPYSVIGPFVELSLDNIELKQ